MEGKTGWETGLRGEYSLAKAKGPFSNDIYWNCYLFIDHLNFAFLF